MRYVPNLIPEKAKVLPHYFKGTPYQSPKRSPLRNTLLWMLGILLFLYALAWITYPILFLLCGTAGFIAIPPGRKILENKLRFTLTSRIKVVTIAILLIISAPFFAYYKEKDKAKALLLAQEKQKAEKEKALWQQKEQIRIDSLKYFIDKSRQLANENKQNEAALQLDYASAFAITPGEKEEINTQSIEFSVQTTIKLVKAGKYEEALPELAYLRQVKPANTEIQYYAALCYSKTGKIQEAVQILQPLIGQGNPEAEKLHDKINPVRKEIIGYTTLCCDGTTSSARGRGACSHHGGVCDWNHPIYQESRKY